MSQMTATARVGLRAPERRAAPRLRVVGGADTRSSGLPFAIVCVGLLVAGLITLLLLNTALARGSFTMGDLSSTSGQLTDTEMTLRSELQAQEAPASLAHRAVQQGMVPSASSAFIRLSDGKVLGVAKAASKDKTFTVVTRPTPAPAKTASDARAGAVAASAATAGSATARKGATDPRGKDTSGTKPGTTKR